MKMFLPLFLLAYSLSIPHPVEAGERQVCQDGKVRYTACPEETANPSIYGKNPAGRSEITRGLGNRLKLVTRSAAPTPGNQRFVRIFNESFTKLNPRVGLWKGKISGNGKVYLTLAILQNGQMVTTRYIGSVQVTPDERPTRFNFKSPLPELSNWSWKILPRVL